MDLKRPDHDAGVSDPPLYPVAGWLRPGRVGLAEPAFAAGAAFAALDRVMRDSPSWSGVWMQRLRLQAAATACQHLGRPESEQSLRDLWQLRIDGGAVGPAGQVLNAYQDLGRSEPLHGDVLARVAAAFGFPEREGRALAPRLVAATREAGPLQAAAIAATLAAEEAGTIGRPGELLALWAADAMLTRKLGWGRAVPLLSAELIKRGGAPRRPRPGDPEWLAAAALGAAVAAVRAVDLANEVARRAAKLEAVGRQVRTKQAGAVIRVLLAQDAVTAGQVRGLLSDRAARRRFDRLVALGGVRELAGRSVFRMYGL